ncbi:SELU-like protein [Mya arenaria]|uniref:SELU-like protein n=1 Tax=Mya arenaria TaxID=6604 RepID=A0ABY7FQH3_MYAAR|nr:tRNA 2-selenouridine synthase-like [Mya arenaria]WAR22973.1 SELU-like protein [Mya arenaria]
MKFNGVKQNTVLKTFLRCYHGRLQPSKSSRPEVIASHKDNRVTEIVDVRTPEEYEEDHIPGSVNLPVLTSLEREEVGLLYSTNRFQARKLGASFISKNISEHIRSFFYSKPDDYSPLVYCWRGGQRSYSLALVLAQIGFDTFTLENGYKQYRQHVRDTVRQIPEDFSYKVISGLTGSGKTRLLHTLAKQGQQIIDLEGLAQHKGSILGLWHGHTQPTQKYFESLLCADLERLSADRCVWLESESVRIGNVYVPDGLFKKLKEAPRFCVNLPLEERVKHIIHDYPNWIENKEALKATISKLVKVRGHEFVNSLLEVIENEDWELFVRRILVEHYDPTYTLSQKKNNSSPGTDKQMNMSNVNEETLDRAAEQLQDHDNGVVNSSNVLSLA